MGYNDQLNKKPESKFHKIIIGKKWLIIGIAIIVLLISGAVSGWIYVSVQKSESDAILLKKEELYKTTSKTTEKAQVLSDNGDQVGAILLLDNAIKLTNDTKTKSLLILNKATTYFNNGDNDNALEAALQSEAIDKNSNIEKLIAMIYEQKGDTQNAIKYYQNAIILVDKNEPYANSNIKDYQNIIDTLSGVKK